MKDFFKTFGYFFTTYPRATGLMVALIVLAGIVEAFGIMAFLPFLQIVFQGQSEAGAASSHLYSFLNFFGLQPDFPVFAGIIAGAIGLKALILWFSMRYVSWQVAVIAENFRMAYIRALLKANWKHFTHSPVGGMLNSIGMETFRSSLAFLMTTRVLASFIQFVVYAISALLVSWQVFAGGLLIGLILVVSLWGLIGSARRAGTVQTRVEKNMLSTIAGVLQGIKPLRAMSLEKESLNFLDQHSENMRDSQFRQTFTKQCIRIFHEPLMVFSAIIGIYLIMRYTNLQVSELALMGILFIRMLTSLNNAQSEYQSLVVQESALWALIRSIKDVEAAEERWPGHENPPSVIEQIEFRGVGFSYDEKAILEQASMKIEPYKMTALIGSSGAGKSTSLDLLCGFYKPVAGGIFINGVDMKDLDLAGWRHRLGFVPQEIFLFNDSVFENICCGRPGVSEDDVWKALEAAGARDFVEQLPEKLYAGVGENGRLLSGGQRQRLAIARAIVHKPLVLLLDEATSALDADTEQKILKTLKDLARSMTVICVSHNDRVIGYSDVVYEFSGGQIK